MKRLFCLPACLVLLCVVLPRTALCQTSTADARAFADASLKLFDNGDCAQLYDQFDEQSKTLTREQWKQTCSTIRKQRGSVISRNLSNQTKSMGMYRFIFNTQCSEGKVFEDITVINRDGQWKLAGFMVSPNLT